MRISRGLTAPEAIPFSLILRELFSLTFQPYESAADELIFFFFLFLSSLLDLQRLESAVCEEGAVVVGALCLNCEAWKSERVMPGSL